MYKVFFILLMIFSSNTTSSKNLFFLDDNSDRIISNYLDTKFLIGRANYSFLIWNIYDAELYSNNKMFNSNKYAIILKYNRSISKERLVNETINDMKEQKKISSKKINEWMDLLNSIYQRTDIGKKFIAIRLDLQTSVFYYDGRKIHKSTDKEFNELFFNIWLRENSKNPEFTRNLLGRKQ